jgi:hypothetical protein
MRSTQRNLGLYKSICSCSRPVRNGKPTGAPVLQKAYGPVAVDTGESRECLAEPLASHSFQRGNATGSRPGRPFAYFPPDNRPL